MSQQSTHAPTSEQVEIPKSCAQCGSTERYRNGHCAPCTRASNQKWKKANKAKHVAGSARWAKQNPERAKEAGARWRQKNPEKIRANTKQWRQKNTDRHVAHNHKRRALKANSSGQYTRQEWEALCERHHYRCLACGRQGVALTVDHVVALTRGGDNTIDNIQPLCGPCNSRKATQDVDYRYGPYASHGSLPEDTMTDSPDLFAAARRIALEADIALLESKRAEIALLDALDDAIHQRREAAHRVVNAADSQSARNFAVELAIAIAAESAAERALTGEASAERNPTPTQPAASAAVSTSSAGGVPPAPACVPEPPAKKPRKPRKARTKDISTHVLDELEELADKLEAKVKLPEAPDSWRAEWEAVCAELCVSERLKTAPAHVGPALSRMCTAAMAAKDRAEFDVTVAELRALFDSLDGEQTAVIPFAPPAVPPDGAADVDVTEGNVVQGLFGPIVEKTPTAASEGR